MKRGTVFIILGVLLLTFFLAQMNDDSSLIGKVIDDLQASNEENSRAIVQEGVLEVLENEDNVRVFVNLEDSEESRSVSSKDEIAEITQGEIVHEFDDKISMIVSEDELLELQNNPNVESVELVKTRSIGLQDSVPLIKGTDTWNLQPEGINLTGEGQTICIIDTGVKYTHADLGGCYGDNDVSSSCKVIGGIDYCADDTNCTTTDTDPLDVNGHGTHVAGIAAANGNLKGVAPGAKIIMIKAANSSGTFWDDDLETAMQWCIDNATKFNISVISMSLGGRWGVTGYCDSLDALTNEVDEAFAAGISVVAATGNDALTNEIHGPACIQNATPVGGSTKEDGMYSSGNRNALVQLLAPGQSINSTYTSSAYAALSGTSMATPHVAGAIAIIKQYLNLAGDSLTPAEIESLLSNKGKQIADSGSGLTYSRIDIYSAIISLDDSVDEVTLVSPADNSYLESENAIFTCSASDIFGLANITFHLWNNTGGEVASAFNDVSGNYSSTVSMNIANLTNGTYNWNCQAYDKQNNDLWASSNFTKIVGKLAMNLSSPADNSYKSSSGTDFTCIAEDSVSDLSETTFYLWNSTSDLIYNETKIISGNLNSTTFNYTLSAEGSYEWNCYSLDEEWNVIYSDSNSTLIYDFTSPSVTLTSPAEQEEVGENQVNFMYVPTDANIKNCSLYLEGIVNESDVTITSGSTNAFADIQLADGSYRWGVSCYDHAGNYNVLTEWEFEVVTSTVVGEEDDDSDESAEPEEPAGDSSPAPLTAPTNMPSIFYLNSSSIRDGVNRSIKVNDIIRFNTTSEDSHVLILDSASATEAEITLSSDPVKLTIQKDKTEMADLDNNNFYDISVNYVGAVNALYYKLYLKEVNVPVPVRQATEENESQVNATSKKVDRRKWNITGKMSTFWDNKTNKIAVYIILLSLLFVGLVYLIYKKRDIIIDSVVGLLSKSEDGLKDLKDKKGEIALFPLEGISSKTLKKQKKNKAKKDNQLSRDDFKEEQYF